MPYGSALGVTAPTVSVTVGPTYATQVNTYLDALRAVVEAKVTPGGFNMNTDLSFLASGTNRSAVDLLTAAFEVQSTLLTAGSNPAAVFAGGVDGDLFFNDAAGNQIQITSGGTLNSSTTGGITGAGYGSGGVEVNFNAGLLGYQFLAGAGVFADLIADDLLLNDGDANFVSIVSPPLAADYTLTLPTAPPASTALVTMSAAGTLAASNTVPSATTFTGLVTASAGVTAAADQHVTVSGTGRFKHGTMTLFLHGSQFNPTLQTDGVTRGVAGGQNTSGASTGLHAAIPLPVGALLSVTAHINASATPGTRSCNLSDVDTLDGSVNSASVANSTAISSNYSLSPAGSLTVATGFIPVVVVTLQNNDRLHGVTVSWTMP